MEADLPRKAHQYARCTNRKQIQFEIRGLYNYYRLAVNVSVLNSFTELCVEACSKPLAANIALRTNTSRSNMYVTVFPCGLWQSLGRLGVVVITFVLILTVYGRFFKIFTYIAIAPIPLSTFAGEPTQNVGEAS